MDIEVKVTLPRGYKLKKESKTVRTSIIMRPTYFALLDQLVAESGEKSRNALLNRIVEDYIDKVLGERGWD